MVEDLKDEGLLERIDDTYTHSVPVCKAGHEIEPTVLPNWFIKVETLKKPAFEAVKTGKVKIYPKWREITYIRWVESMHDWAISRQNVWGIRIPAWYNVEKNPDVIVSFLHKEGQTITGRIGELTTTYALDEIKRGLQSLMAPAHAIYMISITSPGEMFIQETNTFDTWFSSGL